MYISVFTFLCEDGAVEIMALEDIAMFRSLPSSSIFYPCDTVSTEHSILPAAKTKGITFTTENHKMCI